MLQISGVTETNAEIRYGTAATIACKVNDIGVNSSVVWRNSNGEDVSLIDSSSSYAITSESYDSTSRNQKFYLEMSEDMNLENITYTCDITPNGGNVHSTTAHLYVFRKYLK